MPYCALLPLVGGALLPLFRFGRREMRWYASIITFGTSCLVWILLAAGDEGVRTLFRLSPAYSFAFGLDEAGKVYLGIASALWPLAVLYGFSYMEHEERENSFFAFYIIAYGVSILLGTAANLFTLYILFEFLTLSTLPLVWHKFNKASFRAARSYLLYLFGGGALGLTALVVLSTRGECAFLAGGILTDAAEGSGLLRWMYLFAFFGFGAKAAVFPLFHWLPQASVAPTPVTALLHAVAVVNAGVFSVLRATYYVFGADFLAGSAPQHIATAFSAFTVVFGAVMAVREQHFKRRLAYSTVSNLSYMLGVITLMSGAGCAAGMIHMAFHSLMKLVLFWCAGAVLVNSGREYLSELPGIGRRMPVTFAAFTLAGLALVGVPPLIGFTSKYRLLTAAIESGGIFGDLYAVSLLISAVLTAIYILPVILSAWFLPERVPADGRTREAGALMLIPMGICCAAILAVSLFPGVITDFLSGIAASVG